MVGNIRYFSPSFTSKISTHTHMKSNFYTIYVFGSFWDPNIITLILQFKRKNLSIPTRNLISESEFDMMNSIELYLTIIKNTKPNDYKMELYMSILSYT